MVSRVLVLACLLGVAHGATSDATKDEKVAHDSTSDAQDDTDLSEEDMKLLIDKLGDDDFVDQVVGKMVDKLFSSDLLTSVLQGQDDQEPLDLSEYEDAGDDEQANAQDEQKYDDQQDEDEDEDEQQQQEDDNQEDDDQQEEQEQQEEPATEELAEEPADAGNPLFALCDPGTLAASSALGAGLACVVFFVKTVFERMFFTKPEANLAGYAMLEA